MTQENEFLSDRFFPNATPQGHYRPYSFTAHLAVTRSEFEERHKAIREDKAAFLAGVWPIMSHEYQHGIDHIATLFGKAWMRHIFNALNVLFWKRQELNRGFDQLLALHDFQRRAFRSQYYTMFDETFCEPYDGANPWQIQSTIGFEFDTAGETDTSRPMLFAQFFDHAGDTYFARQPITAASLFELRAVSVQLDCETHFQQSLKSKPLDRKFEHNTLDRVYDPSLTLYSVAAHFLAVTAGITETNETYRKGAGLAHVALNLSAEHFALLKFPDYIKEAAGEAIGALKKICDVGAAFAALVWAAPKAKGMPTDEWVEAAVANAGLPVRQEIMDQAQDTIKKIDQLDVDGPFSMHYRALCAAGAICHSELRSSDGLFYRPKLIEDGLLERLPMPMLGYADGDLGQFFGQPLLSTSQQEELLAYERHLLTEVDDFVRACR